jgi:broad specificity phosphatase PhoE
MTTTWIEPRNAGLNGAFQGIAADQRMPAGGMALSPQPSIRFFIMRHGESWGQIDIGWYKKPGDAAIPLSDWGKRQSLEGGRFLNELAAARNLGTFEVFSSTCLRTRQTAGCAIAGIGPERVRSSREDVRLDKQLFGIFSGIFDDAEKARLYPRESADYRRQITERGLFHARPHGGESIAAVQAKAADFVRSVLHGHDGGAPRNILIVTHGLVALCVENALLHHGEEWVVANIDRGDNCSIKLVEAAGGAFAASEVGKGLKRPYAAAPADATARAGLVL